LLLPRERHKTLTARAGAEPIVEALDRRVQRLAAMRDQARRVGRVFLRPRR
jgi:hypothetical protein